LLSLADRRDGDDWLFLTCESESALAPILADYDQWVQRDYDGDGNYRGSMSHILRVFLVDADGRIRNIYSPSFLHADLLPADLRTLRLERTPSH
jgi:cytochrome oxidase Cu insertion factor (SCO1/SenC/PrrC family)